MESPKRYHPVLVTLHWLIALLVFANLIIGFFEFAPQLQGGGGFRAEIPESLIAIHMALGVGILVLIVVRFFTRLGTRRPAPADSGNRFVDALAQAIHYALYFFVFAITVVGLVFALQTNRFQRAFLGASGPQFAGPGGGSFRGFPTPGPGTPRPSFGGGNNFGNQPGGSFRGGGPRGRFGFAFFLLPLHRDLAILLAVLIGLHILAAIYHQFIRRDNLLSRMWYGRS